MQVRTPREQQRREQHNSGQSSHSQPPHDRARAAVRSIRNLPGPAVHPADPRRYRSAREFRRTLARRAPGWPRRRSGTPWCNHGFSALWLPFGWSGLGKFRAWRRSASSMTRDATGALAWSRFSQRATSPAGIGPPKPAQLRCACPGRPPRDCRCAPRARRGPIWRRLRSGTRSPRRESAGRARPPRRIAPPAGPTRRPRRSAARISAGTR